MDKETLSNYGWIVICVMVLAVMIALATPFGSFISEAVQSTTKGLFDVNENALGVAGITIDDNAFAEGNGGAGENGGAGQNPVTPVPIAGSATFNDGVTLTWDELKLAENGTKYRYNASKITDTSIGDYAFEYCLSLTSITIPDSVTSIGDGAFEDCDSLTSINIPDGITSIGYSTFYGCPISTSITIPDSVTEIGQSAFNSCFSLPSITIPDSVTSIGNYAFSRCEGLTDVYYTGTQEQWNAITIGSYNTYLTNATIHYNYVP